MVNAKVVDEKKKSASRPTRTHATNFSPYNSPAIPHVPQLCLCWSSLDGVLGFSAALPLPALFLSAVKYDTQAHIASAEPSIV